MQGHSKWSYTPYQPPLWEMGDIYICRVVPDECSVHFEWLDRGQKSYDVFYRVSGSEEYTLAGSTTKTVYDIKGLMTDTDYEFFVRSGELKSRSRLARCGKAVGTVVNYLHPDDTVYSFSGKYLCSPSLVRHPDGFLLASTDLYAPDAPQNLTLIFRSDDNGETWHYISELMPCFWGKMFIHKGILYMLGCSTEYGDLLIGKSEDDGRTFSAPVALLRGAGKKTQVGVHKNPQNIIEYKGRVYETLEWGSWANKDYHHAAMVMSCDSDADLLIPENWHFTPPLKYSASWEGTAPDGGSGTIEGTLAVAPDGKLYNYMRYQTKEKKILAYLVPDVPDKPIEYSNSIVFPGNLSKFMIKYDSVSKRYYSIICQRIDEPETRRNLLSLVCSPDAESWNTVCDLIDRRYENPDKTGFQYVDFEFDGNDIIFLCRTAVNGAHSYHDSNYLTFHRINSFRKLI